MYILAFVMVILALKSRVDLPEPFKSTVGFLPTLIARIVEKIFGRRTLARWARMSFVVTLGFNFLVWCYGPKEMSGLLIVVGDALFSALMWSIISLFYGDHYPN